MWRKRFSDGLRQSARPTIHRLFARCRREGGGHSSSASQANRAPYEYSRVSVPESIKDSPFLEEILDVEG